MYSRLVAGLLLAAASASAYNAGAVVEKVGLRRLPPLEARRLLHMLRSLFTERVWVAGFVLLVVGLGTQVLALTLAPISLVQSMSALGVILLVVLSHFVLGDDLGRGEYLGIGLVVSALVLLALSVQPHVDVAGSNTSALSLALVTAAGLAASLGCFIGALRVGGTPGESARRRAPLFGVASGLAYGVAALAVKSVSTVVQRTGVSRSIPRVLTSPALYLLIVASAAGFLLFQTALQRSRASIFVVVSNVTSSTFFIAFGTIAFHEHLPTAPLRLAFRIAGIVVTVVGLCVLAVSKEVEMKSESDLGILDATGEVASAASTPLDPAAPTSAVLD